MYFEQGLIFAAAQDFSAAVNCFDKAIGLNPQFTNARYNKASTLSLQGDLEAAFELLQQAIEIDPEYREMAKTDTDFDRLRDDGRFRSLVQGSGGK